MPCPIGQGPTKNAHPSCTSCGAKELTYDTGSKRIPCKGASTFPPFLTQAYNLKAVADYEIGPNADIPPEHSAAALETAARFVDCIAGLLDDDE